MPEPTPEPISDPESPSGSAPARLAAWRSLATAVRTALAALPAVAADPTVAAVARRIDRGLTEPVLPAPVSGGPEDVVNAATPAAMTLNAAMTLPGLLDPPRRAAFARAVAGAQAHGGPAAALAAALDAHRHRFDWYQRVVADDAPFMASHANSILLGRHGLARHPWLHIGLSLLLPDTRYPDHRHPPAELYLVIGPGLWRQRADPWHAPGIGGVVYNPPDVVHAMRSTETPLLALWCLLTD